MEEGNDTYSRWRFLFENPAVVRSGWLPPGGSVPELAELRNHHTRLLSAHTDANAQAIDLQARRRAEEEARRSAQEREFLSSGQTGKLPKLTITDEMVTDARIRAEAAQDAVQTFVQRAIMEIRERSPELRAGFDQVASEAYEKREQARVLIAEADRIEMSTRKLDAWLARFDGRSFLGYITWADLPDPVHAPTPTLEELHAAQYPPMADVIELQDGPGAPAFGTDDPDDLDPDPDDAAARPWEVRLPA